MKKIITFVLALLIIVIAIIRIGFGDSSSTDQIVIYTNADDEAVRAMKNALDNNGYDGKYIMQSFGTSE